MQDSTSMFSDEYDADMIGAGFQYKRDTMADNFFGTLAHKLEITDLSQIDGEEHLDL